MSSLGFLKIIIMNRQQYKISAITSTLILSVLLLFATTNLYPNHVLITICILPFIIGFLPTYMVGGKHPMPKTESYNLSFTTLGLSLLVFIIFAFKNINLLDILLTGLLAAPVVWVSSYLAFSINDRRIIKVKDFFR